MTETIQTPSRTALPGKFHDAAEWLHELGDIPLERIVMDPWPGTATEQDLLLFVERDKRLCELIDGTLVEKPMGSYESLIAGILTHALNAFVLPRKLGYVLGEAGMLQMVADRIRMPDVSFMSVEDLEGGLLPKTPVWRLPPRIAIEVLSESNTATEIHQKLIEYFDSGARLAWIVDPAVQTVAVYTRASESPDRILSIGDTLHGGSVLPEFELKVADLFVASQSEK